MSGKLFDDLPHLLYKLVLVVKPIYFKQMNDSLQNLSWDWQWVEGEFAVADREQSYLWIW